MRLDEIAKRERTFAENKSLKPARRAADDQ
jgi:hypothetical protein